MELRMRRLFALVIVLLLAVAPWALAQAQTEEPAQTPQAGDEWTEPFTGMEFVWVPGGCYEMGCGEWAGDCWDDELPVHEVCVDGFWMGKYEVTQAQWDLVMRPETERGEESVTLQERASVSNDWEHDARYPVINVSWNDALEYISHLSSMSSRNVAYNLPTEEEWEYACRSGGHEELYAGGGNAELVAWYGQGDINGQYAPVGTKQPNGLGIYDMSGNVWEWIANRYAEYLPQSNSTSGNSRNANRYPIIRGGGWETYDWHVRCSKRGFAIPDRRANYIGFRLVIHTRQ